MPRENVTPRQAAAHLIYSNIHMTKDVEDMSGFLNHLGSTLENMRAHNADRAGRNTPARRNYETLRQLYESGMVLNTALRDAENANSQNTEKPDRIIRRVVPAYTGFNNQLRSIQQNQPALLGQVYAGTGNQEYNYFHTWEGMECREGQTVLDRVERQEAPFEPVGPAVKDFDKRAAASTTIGSYLGLEGDRHEYENLGNFIDSLDARIAELRDGAFETEEEARQAQEEASSLEQIRSSAASYKQLCEEAGDLFDEGNLKLADEKIAQAQQAAADLEGDINVALNYNPQTLDHLTEEEGEAHPFLTQWKERDYEAGTFGEAYNLKKTGHKINYDTWAGFVENNTGRTEYKDTELDVARTVLSRVMVGKMKQAGGEELTYDSMTDMEEKAARLREDPSFLEMTEDVAAINTALKSPEAVTAAVTEYGKVRGDYCAGIKGQLSWLGKTMDPDLTGRTTGWQNLHRAINDPHFNANNSRSVDAVLNAIDHYTRGKEGLRKSIEKGRYSFDQAMDALAIVAQSSPAAKAKANKIVERINTVRAAKGQPLVNLDDHLERVPDAQTARQYQENPEYRQYLGNVTKDSLKRMSSVISLENTDSSAWKKVVQSVKNNTRGDLNAQGVSEIFENARQYSLGQYYKMGDGKMSRRKSPEVDETGLRQSLDLIAVISRTSPEYQGQADRLLAQINRAREKNLQEPISLEEHGVGRMMQDYKEAGVHYLDEEAERQIMGHADSDTFYEESSVDEKSSRTSSVSEVSVAPSLNSSF